MLTEARRQAITTRLQGRTDWTCLPGNGCLQVSLGRLCYYFVFDGDELVNVILD